MKPVLLLLLLTACGGRTLVIESDTSWQGSLDGTGAIQGTGNTTHDVNSQVTPICWSIQKTDSVGVLRAYMDTDTWFGLGNEIDALTITTEPGGVVSGCVK